MSKKIHDWIAAQIESHRLGATDWTNITRVAEAAASLRAPALRGTAFGLTLPAGGIEGADALAKRCDEVVREWLPSLDSGQRKQLATILGDIETRHAPVPEPAPDLVAHLHVFVAAEVENVDTEEPVTDAAVLSRLDGLALGNGRLLLDHVVITNVVGRKPYAHESDKPDPRLVRDASVGLEYDGETETLVCRLTFGFVVDPEPDVVARLLDVIEKDLFFSSWGTNMDWDTGAIEGCEDLSVRTGTKVLRHRIDAV